MKIVLLWSSFGPYHLVRLHATQKRMVQDGVEVIGCRFAERSLTYSWGSCGGKSDGIVTFSDSEEGVFAAFRIFVRFLLFLKTENVGIVFLPSWWPLANFLCLVGAKLVGSKIVMMTESWAKTEKATGLSRIIKKLAFRACHGALVGGSPHRIQVERYGIPCDKVEIGYDVVDVEGLGRSADAWRVSDGTIVGGLRVPGRYFLSLGRFVAKKNLALLVSAYAKLHFAGLTGGAALVFVGEGELEGRLKDQCRSLGLKVFQGEAVTCAGGDVCFYPFQQWEEVSFFYAKCEALVLPSAEEEWGLVVNEVMACGRPAIVSNNVGSAEDLVVPGKTGLIFESGDEISLYECLKAYAMKPEPSESHGENARAHIQCWKPERFAVAVESLVIKLMKGRTSH